MQTKLYFYTFILLCCAQSGYGQYVIKGILLDSENKGVPYATVTINKQGVLASSNGVFEAQVNSQFAEIFISHVGFEPVRDTLILPNDTTFVKYQLIPQEFDTLRIQNTRYSNYVLSFEVVDHIIYELVKSNKQHYLKVLNLDFKVIDSKRVSKKFKSIEKDCLGNIHLMSDTEVLQYAYSGRKIQLVNTASYKDYTEQIRRCQVYFDSSVVFSKRMMINQYLVYHLLSKGEKKLIASVYDRKTLLDAYSAAGPVIFADMDTAQTPDYLSETQIGIWDGELKRIMKPQFIKEVGWFYAFASKPVYSPMFFSKNKLWLFDFVNDSVSCYSKQGDKLEEWNVDFHEQKNWIEQVYFDKSQEQFYTMYKQNGFFINSIIIADDKVVLGPRFQPCTSCYPENIIIDNQVAYFISNGKLRKMYLQ